MTLSNDSPALPNLLLRRAREQQGWTQSELAKRLDTNPFTVCRWERGTTSPSLHYRKKLCDLFHQSDVSLGLFSPTPLDLTTAIEDSQIAMTLPAIMLDSHIPYHALIGREDVVDALASSLQASTPMAIALYGLPGVGKTALAATLASLPRVLACFPDGVLWAGLGPQPASITHLGRWATTLGLTATDLSTMTTVRAVSETLHMLIGEQRMLIVLDDAWTIEEALAYKVGGSHCAYILTTRFPPLASQFAHNQAFHLPEFDQETSIAFLRHFQPAMTLWDPMELHMLARAVGGLPLALQLVGHYLQMQSLSQQPRRIQHALESLRHRGTRLRLAEPIAPFERPPALSPDASYSLEAVIDISVTVLSAQAKQVLHLLTLFPAKPNSFAEEAVLALCDLPIEQVFGAVDSLSDAGLLESGGEGRYVLHQTINDYAHLAMYDLANLHALLRFYRQQLLEADARSSLFDQEIANLMAVCEAVFQQGSGMEFVESVLSFMDYFSQRGLYAQGGLLLQHAYETAQATQARRELLELMLWLGRNHESLGDYAVALGWAQAGSALAQELQDERMEIRLQHLIAMLLRKQGDGVLAEQILVNGFERVVTLHEPALTLPYLTSLGALMSDRGDSTRAKALFQQGLEVSQELGDRHNVSRFLQNLGVLAARAGSLDDARMYFSRGLAVARDLGERRLIAKGLRYIGHVILDQGDDIVATAYLEEGLAIAREIGFHEALYALLSLLGEASLAQGAYDHARRYAEESYQIIKGSTNRAGIANVLVSLGDICRHQGQLQVAERYLQESLAIVRALERKEGIAKTLHSLGELYLDRAAYESAAETFREMEAIATEYGYQEMYGLSLYGRARVAVQSGDMATALHFGNESMRLLEISTSHQADEVRRWLSMIQR